MFFTNKKGVLYFFIGYVLLLISIITAVIFSPINLDERYNTTQESTTFTEELQRYEEKKMEKQKSNETGNAWGVSDEFAMIAIVTASILDIVIVLLWARSENRKREGIIRNPEQKRWRDTKIFWHIVALGVILPKENRLRVNWVNMIAIIVLIHFLFYLLTKN